MTEVTYALIYVQFAHALPVSDDSIAVVYCKPKNIFLSYIVNNWKILILKNNIFVCKFKLLLNYFKTTNQFETITCFSLLCSFGFLFGTFISLWDVLCSFRIQLFMFI